MTTADRHAEPISTTSGDWILWVLFIALPAIAIYPIGHLLGFW